MPSAPDKGEYPIKLGTLLFTMVEPDAGTSSNTTAGTSTTTSMPDAWSVRGSSPATVSSRPAGSRTSATPPRPT